MEGETQEETAEEDADTKSLIPSRPGEKFKSKLAEQYMKEDQDEQAKVCEVERIKLRENGIAHKMVSADFSWTKSAKAAGSLKKRLATAETLTSLHNETPSKTSRHAQLATLINHLERRFDGFARNYPDFDLVKEVDRSALLRINTHFFTSFVLAKYLKAGSAQEQRRWLGIEDDEDDDDDEDMDTAADKQKLKRMTLQRLLAVLRLPLSKELRAESVALLRHDTEKPSPFPTRASGYGDRI